jgi:hypothetical protein
MQPYVRTVIKSAVARGFAATMAMGAIVPANVFYANGPGFHVWIGHHPRYCDHYARGGGRGTWNGTWNGCPPNWTIQGGVYKPYHYGCVTGTTTKRRF